MGLLWEIYRVPTYIDPCH